MPTHRPIPEVLRAYSAKTIHFTDAVEEIMPAVDAMLAFEAIPVVGLAVEEISDLFLRPMAEGIVHAWEAGQRKAKARTGR